MNADLTAFIIRNYGMVASSFTVAVCGSRIVSEHEDECCVMMELHTTGLVTEVKAVGPLDESQLKAHLESTFIQMANTSSARISKGSKVRVNK